MIADDLLKKIKSTAIYALMAWVFIWENANKLTMMNAYGIKIRSGLVFGFLPDKTKYIEPAILFILFTLIIVDTFVFRMKINLSFFKLFIITLIIGLMTQIANSLINGTIDFYMYDMLYKTYRPIILIIVIYYCATNPPRNLIIVNITFLFFILINIVLAIFQITTYAYGVDMVTGFMRSAHTLGIILVYFLILLFFYFKEKKKIIVLPIFCITLLLFLYTSNVKITILLILTILVYAVLEGKTKASAIILYLFLLFIFLFIANFLINKFDIQGFERIEKLMHYSPLDYPIFKTLYHLPLLFKQNLFAPFLLGFGHGYFERYDVIISTANDLEARELVFFKYQEIFSLIGFNKSLITQIPITMLLEPFSSALQLIYSQGFIAFALYIWNFNIIYKKYLTIKKKQCSGLPIYFINTIWFILLFSILNFLFMPGVKVISNIAFSFPLLINIGIIFKYEDLSLNYEDQSGNPLKSFSSLLRQKKAKIS